MEQINFEVDAENVTQNSDEEFSLSAGEDNFIDGSAKEDSPSFYRFPDQTHDLAEALDDDDRSHLDTRDLQPEMFLTVGREYDEFDDFDEAGKCAEKFLKSMVRFQDADIRDSFFDSIFYGLLFNFFEKSTEVLGEEFYNKLISEKTIFSQMILLKAF